VDFHSVVRAQPESSWSTTALNELNDGFRRRRTTLAGAQPPIFVTNIGETAVCCVSPWSPKWLVLVLSSVVSGSLVDFS
jgi:hypothetical protein